MCSIRTPATCGVALRCPRQRTPNPPSPCFACLSEGGLGLLERCVEPARGEVGVPPRGRGELVIPLRFHI
jgi:hypothetical protein